MPPPTSTYEYQISMITTDSEFEVIGSIATAAQYFIPTVVILSRAMFRRLTRFSMRSTFAQSCTKSRSSALSCSLACTGTQWSTPSMRS